MPKRSVLLTHRMQRSVLTDMLPFEVPPTFSNRGFYKFLRDHSVEFEDRFLQWKAGVEQIDKLICLIFGITDQSKIDSENVSEWGSTFVRHKIPISSCKMNTIPFNFQVSHNLGGRTLSVVHPRNQVRVASFYAMHSALITYYSSRSAFSIRKPVSVSRYVFYKDKLHEQRFERSSMGIEEDSREYEQIGSYFVYKDYRNIHQFFESRKYHRCEKKYNAMVQLDISRCFDSIYTHSLPWSIIGKPQTKFYLEESKKTFAGRFDELMQQLNHQETNGIVIGPEFSRLFAEIILQDVDVELENQLRTSAKLTHKTDYEIFRYVDDYFVFYNEQSTELKVIETLQEILKTKKLSINTSKIKSYPKPIITEITIAKERISQLLASEIVIQRSDNSQSGDSETNLDNLIFQVNSNKLIVRYKMILKEASVEYGSLINYTFAILESKIVEIIKIYEGTHRPSNSSKSAVSAVISILEFAFFAYSSSPKVNFTIRLCRMMSIAVEFVRRHRFSHDLKHFLFKFIHDNIIQMLDKNTMSTYREVESLYLLISLSQIGKEYWLPEKMLAKHFLIKSDEVSGEYMRNDFLSHFQ